MPKSLRGVFLSPFLAGTHYFYYTGVSSQVLVYPEMAAIPRTITIVDIHPEMAAVLCPAKIADIHPKMVQNC